MGYPNIDRANGGSLKGILEAFDTLIAAAGPGTKVLPGHGPITNRAGIVAAPAHGGHASAITSPNCGREARRWSRWSPRR